MTAVRHATLQDVDALLELGATMHRESPRYRERDFDRERLRLVLTTVITEGGAEAAIFVAQRENSITGMIAVSCAQDLFGKDRHAGDVIFYVGQPDRGSRAASMLVKVAEDWARVVGARTFSLGESSGINAECTRRFYGKMGYTYAATAFDKGLA